jgi:putative sigma-54 modulation protein
MDLTIHGRNIQITDSIEQYVQKKIGRLERYLSTLDQARVDIREEHTRKAGKQVIVQVTLHEKRGKILRGEERRPELSSAVDLVFDKMNRKISRFKGKRKGRYQRAQLEDKWANDFPDEWEEEEEEHELVRTKRFAISSMNAEEAIEQMELLGHSFFLYYDGNEGGVNVVYRRHDGNYGLLIPELV